MDYAVGSLSDLITGSHTPNKPKVVKKQFIKTETPHNDMDSQENQTNIEVNTVVSKKSRKLKVKKEKAIKPASNETPRVKGKKRKLSEVVEENDTSQTKQGTNSENAEKRIKLKEKVKHQEDPESVARTVFVGNLPISSDTKKLKRFFGKYGNVEAVRVRGAPVADLKTPKKVAIIKKEFHPERKSFYGYVRYATREEAVKATEANGLIYKNHHLRVHLCDTGEKPDEAKAIFIGNLSFYAEEDDLWKLFESCGPISSVRIVRDSKTGIGKGFGYVNFHNSDSVPLALEMEAVKVKERELRISICNNNAAKKNKKNNKIKKINKPGKPKVFKQKNKQPKNIDKNNEKPVQFKKPFQGVKLAEKKRKNKPNKNLLMKKKIIKKVAPKQ